MAKKIKEAIRPMIFPEIEHEILDGRDVIRVDFSGSEKPYSSYGRYYKRVFDRTEEMTPDELKRMMASQDYTSYWENNLTNFGMESVGINSLENFYKQAISCGRIEKIGDFNAEEHPFHKEVHKTAFEGITVLVGLVNKKPINYLESILSCNCHSTLPKARLISD